LSVIYDLSGIAEKLYQHTGQENLVKRLVLSHEARYRLGLPPGATKIHTSCGEVEIICE